jgi:hypothetical protein
MNEEERKERRKAEEAARLEEADARLAAQIQAEIEKTTPPPAYSLRSRK